MDGSFVVLTGASGGGKTTIASVIKAKHPEFTIFHFDSIGIPSAEVMEQFGPGHQPGGAWQRAMTLRWFERIAPIVKGGGRVLFEGQMRIAFVQQGLAKCNISDARVILVECDDETRIDRITNDRQQPELANESMMGWSRFLHEEALQGGYEILDTGAITLTESVRRIVRYLDDSIHGSCDQA
ncbi:AAA family ATPase [Granulicella sp. S190]|uniref:AAA family ATPase n=1 Tax=Granulicella sp. S190 TaxID=1747226 RepID=UPI00131D1885|nr:AAA family ATPase [Granulicella sp. S190]